MKSLHVIVGLAVALAAAEPALAQTSRFQDGKVTGSRGRERTIEREVQRDKGKRSVDTTVTGQNGGVGTRSKDLTIDRQAGELSRTETSTGPDGKSRSTDLSATKTGEGQYAIERTVTGINGETRQQTGAGTIARTENGYQASGGLVGETGGVTFDRNATNQDGVRNVSGSVTGADGTMRTLDRTHDSNNGTYDSTRAVTGTDGKTRMVDTQIQKTGTGAEGTRTTTTPDGETRTATGSVTGRVN